MTDSSLTWYLAGRDVPCPQCAYNLRDLVGNRCPECGDELALQLGLAEPRQKLLIAGLVGLSAGAGMSGLLLVYIAIQLVRDGHIGSFIWRFVVVTGAGLLVEGSAIAAWLACWRPIRRAGTVARATLMVGCWLLTLANVLVFSFTIK